MSTIAALLLFVAVTAALPYDPILRKLDPVRFHYVREGGQTHLVDLWMTAGDLQEAARYTPDTQNVYHLFTRANPTVSQPMLLGSNGLLSSSSYDPSRRTVVLIHGWLSDALAECNIVLIPAFLAAADVNVIAVDWGAGAASLDYVQSILNMAASGHSVARFINWLNQATGSTPEQYHIVGFSMGGHQAGIAGRNVNGDIDYITALDPANAWISEDDKFKPSDGTYTEVVHTNGGQIGYLEELGQVDFYPNGGVDMPGCSDAVCNHDRCFHYMAESLTSGGFSGALCASLQEALSGGCRPPPSSGSLQMGGCMPNTGLEP